MNKSRVIAIPIDRLKAVEAFVGRSLARNQTPIVKVRVNADQVDEIRKVIRNE